MSCYFAYAEKQGSLDMWGSVFEQQAPARLIQQVYLKEEGIMLTDDYLSRVADPAETMLTASGEFALSDDMTLEAADGGEHTPVYSMPVLDRIRTSD